MDGSSSTYSTPRSREPIWVAKANALRLSAGKRGRGTIEAEITQAHGEQKIQALGHLFQRITQQFLFAGRSGTVNILSTAARASVSRDP